MRWRAVPNCSTTKVRSIKKINSLRSIFVGVASLKTSLSATAATKMQASRPRRPRGNGRYPNGDRPNIPKFHCSNWNEEETRGALDHNPLHALSGIYGQDRVSRRRPNPCYREKSLLLRAGLRELVVTRRILWLKPVATSSSS